MNYHQKILTWFQNFHKATHSNKAISHGKSNATSSECPQPHGPFKYQKKYTLRSVVVSCYADQISHCASSDLKAAWGSKPYLQAYPQAVTKTIKSLSKEERADVEKTVEKWNEEGPPDDQKQR